MGGIATTTGADLAIVVVMAIMVGMAAIMVGTGVLAIMVLVDLAIMVGLVDLAVIADHL